MTDLGLIQSLGLIVVTGAVFVLLARPLGVPTIVAYIIAGLLLGPLTGILAASEAIHTISEVGIVLLLFLVGLELSLDKIRDIGTVAVVAGAVQMSVIAAGAAGIALLFGFSGIEAVVLGIAMMFSSTVVVVKLLEQRREASALYGRIAIGILLVQDLVVIIVLTFVAGLGGEVELDVAGVARSLGGAFLGMTMLLVGAGLAARFILPRLFSWIARYSEALFVWSLCWCFILVMAAELLHLSPEIGAFLAGVTLAQLPYNHTLRRRVHPLMNFFIAVFFVSLGLDMELGAALQAWLPALVLVVFVMVGKPLIFFTVLPRLRHNTRTTFRTGTTLAQISEFSFIFTALAVAGGLVDSAILSLVAIVGLISMALSTYLIEHGLRLYAWSGAERWLQRFGASPPDGEEPRRTMADHVIVVGMNSLGRRIVRDLVDRGERVVAIDTDAGKLRDLGIPTVLGNVEYASVLEEAGLAHARLLVSALQIEDVNNLLAYHAREAGVPSSIHAFDRSVVDDLRSLQVNHLMMSKNDGIKRMAQELRAMGMMDR